MGLICVNCDTKPKARWVTLQGVITGTVFKPAKIRIFFWFAKLWCKSFFSAGWWRMWANSGKVGHFRGAVVVALLLATYALMFISLGVFQYKKMKIFGKYAVWNRKIFQRASKSGLKYWGKLSATVSFSRVRNTKNQKKFAGLKKSSYICISGFGRKNQLTD